MLLYLYVFCTSHYCFSLTHYQTTNFRLFQTERVCRQQFQIWWKWQKVIQTGRKHCGKRRNCLFLLFPQCFQKACFPGASKGLVVWEWVNSALNDHGCRCTIKCHISYPPGHPHTHTRLLDTQTSPGFYVSAVQVFWKQCRKRRNCSNCLPFPSNLKL